MYSLNFDTIVSRNHEIVNNYTPEKEFNFPIQTYAGTHSDEAVLASTLHTTSGRDHLLVELTPEVLKGERKQNGQKHSLQITRIFCIHCSISGTKLGIAAPDV